ncbi:uncharacterized protein LOC144030145 [Festucalex cinctus]
MATRPPTVRPQERTRHFRVTSGAPNSRQSDAGPQGPSQDPGSTPNPHMSPRPVFYVPAPPQPQFVHYQWPMPFSYNPFAGFPGMGYGMVMPPFPAPPPYIEAPAYVMPHPHVHPVDYRHFLHPMVHAQGPLYQNPNQTRRFRSSYSSCGRETTNSEVQTEPTEGSGSDKEGSVYVVSDSGRGTASCSPSSSSQKQDSAEGEKYTLPSSCVDVDVQDTRKSNSPPAENKDAELCSEVSEKQNRLADLINQENVPPCKNDHCNIWSVSSQDGIVPVCSSSQQEDEVIKERHVSVRDILMCGIPQEVILKASEKGISHNEDQLAFKNHDEYQGLVCHSATKRQNCPRLRENVAVGANVSKKSTDSQNGGARSLNDSDEFQDIEENDIIRLPHGNASGIVPYQSPLNTSRVEGKLNESVWSVESLAPYIPNKEWLMNNGMLKLQMVAERTEEPEKVGLSNQNDILKGNYDGNQSLKLSSSDPAPMSDGWLVFSTPAEKANPPLTPKRNSLQTPELTVSSKPDPAVLSAKNDTSTCVPSESSPPKEAAGGNGSPEPVADQTPNQNMCIVVQEAEIPCTADQRETTSSSSAAPENIASTAQCTLNTRDAVKPDNVENNADDHQSNPQLCIPMADPRMVEFSPGGMGHCFCFGCHCNKFHESMNLNPCEELKPNMGPKGKHRAAQKGKAEGVSMTGRMQKNQKKLGPWKNKRHVKYTSHDE